MNSNNDILEICQRLELKFEILTGKNYTRSSFVECFGRDSLTLAIVYVRGNFHEDVLPLSPNFLIYFYWIKQKCMNHNLFGVLSKTTFRKIFWETANSIFQNLDEVTFHACNHSDSLPSLKNCKHLMDTTPFLVKEPSGTREYQKFFYDSAPSHQCYAFKYLFVVCRTCGKCQFVSPPYRGAIADITIFRSHSQEILNGIGDGNRIIADRIFYSTSDPLFERVVIGYRGNFLSKEEEDWNEGLGFVRGLIERFNQRFKSYQKVFEAPWSTKQPEKHLLLVKSYMNIVNIDLEQHPMKQ